MPALLPHLHPVWDAFWLLCSSRPVSLGVGAIPLGEILTFLKWDDIVDKDEQWRYIRLIYAMDNEYLSIVNKTETKDGK